MAGARSGDGEETENPRFTLLGVMTSQSAALNCGESQLCGGPSV